MPLPYLRHIKSDSARFGDLLSRIDSAAPVTFCPEWSAADLLWHLTEVQYFWGSIVAGRLQDPDAVPQLDRPGNYFEVLTEFGRRSTALVESLADTGPEVPVWTWSDDLTTGFVLRRQAHEALIHRVDAELVSGPIGPIDPDLAADGVDELLRVMIGGVPDWAVFTPDGTKITVVCRNPDFAWGLELGRMVGTGPDSGENHDVPAALIGEPFDSPVITGEAADLDLWLWGRGSTERLTVDGDPAILDRLRRMAAESTR